MEENESKMDVDEDSDSIFESGYEEEVEKMLFQVENTFTSREFKEKCVFDVMQSHLFPPKNYIVPGDVNEFFLPPPKKNESIYLINFFEYDNELFIIITYQYVTDYRGTEWIIRGYDKNFVEVFEEFDLSHSCESIRDIFMMQTFSKMYPKPIIILFCEKRFIILSIDYEKGKKGFYSDHDGFFIEKEWDFKEGSNTQWEKKHKTISYENFACSCAYSKKYVCFLHIKCTKKTEKSFNRNYLVFVDLRNGEYQEFLVEKKKFGSDVLDYTVYEDNFLFSTEKGVWIIEIPQEINKKTKSQSNENFTVKLFIKSYFIQKIVYFENYFILCSLGFIRLYDKRYLSCPCFTFEILCDIIMIKCIKIKKMLIILMYDKSKQIWLYRIKKEKLMCLPLLVKCFDEEIIEIFINRTSEETFCVYYINSKYFYFNQNFYITEDVEEFKTKMVKTKDLVSVTPNKVETEVVTEEITYDLSDITVHSNASKMVKSYQKRMLKEYWTSEKRDDVIGDLLMSQVDDEKKEGLTEKIEIKSDEDEDEDEEIMQIMNDDFVISDVLSELNKGDDNMENTLNMFIDDPIGDLLNENYQQPIEEKKEKKKKKKKKRKKKIFQRRKKKKKIRERERDDDNL